MPLSRRQRRLPPHSLTPPAVDPSRGKTPFGILIPCVGGEKSRQKQRKGRFALCGLGSWKRPTMAGGPPRFSAQALFDWQDIEAVAIGDLSAWMLRRRVGGSSQGRNQHGSCRMERRTKRTRKPHLWMVHSRSSRGGSPLPCSRQQIRKALTRSACRIAGRAHRGRRSFRNSSLVRCCLVAAQPARHIPNRKYL